MQTEIIVALTFALSLTFGQSGGKLIEAPRFWISRSGPRPSRA
jgi:hypothetical protein